MSKKTKAAKKGPGRFERGGDGPGERRIRAKIESGPHAGRNAWLKIRRDVVWAVKGAKMFECVRADGIAGHQFVGSALYLRSVLFGITRVLGVTAMTRLQRLLGPAFVRIESGVLVKLSAVDLEEPVNEGCSRAIGVCVGKRNGESVFEVLVASRDGYRWLLRALTGTPGAPSTRRRRRAARAARTVLERKAPAKLAPPRSRSRRKPSAT